MLNRLALTTFALPLGYALNRADHALTREWGIFTLICELAIPACYWTIGILSLLPISEVDIQGGHAYRAGMYAGPFLFIRAFIYSAYGETTQCTFAR